ncbi:TPA: uracil-DNA glycosylase [bacterium]|nr:uracil-DNA glycosylase [bacterium]
MTKIKCVECKYFKITWDKNFPYGCSILGFKSRKRPSFVVYECSKNPCNFFIQKKQIEKQ